MTLPNLSPVEGQRIKGEWMRGAEDVSSSTHWTDKRKDLRNRLKKARADIPNSVICFISSSFLPSLTCCVFSYRPLGGHAEGRDTICVCQAVTILLPTGERSSDPPHPLCGQRRTLVLWSSQEASMCFFGQLFYQWDRTQNVDGVGAKRPRHIAITRVSIQICHPSIWHRLQPSTVWSLWLHDDREKRNRARGRDAKGGVKAAEETK